MTGGYWRLQGITRDYKRLQWVYMGLQGVTGGYMFSTWGFEGLRGVIRGYKRLKEVRSVKTAIKSCSSWRYMVSENEPFRNHELYTTETLRHRPANID